MKLAAQKLLFIGDSITEGSRNDSLELGTGFVYMIHAYLGAFRTERPFEVINRGIGGNRIRDLRERWDRDCMALAPDIVTVMIGVNDAARRYDRMDPTPVEEYKEIYSQLLTQVRNELKAKLVLMEPFLLHTSDIRNRWREDLDPKIDAVRQLARELEVPLIALDSIFTSLAKQTSMEHWLPDGVHPSPSGHAIIAKEWLKAAGFYQG